MTDCSLQKTPTCPRPFHNHPPQPPMRRKMQARPVDQTSPTSLRPHPPYLHSRPLEKIQSSSTIPPYTTFATSRRA